MEDIFEECRSINQYLERGEELDARNNLIRLLDFHEKSGLAYSELVNALIRKVGLFPYMTMKNCHWSDEIAYQSFAVDAGDGKVILHREQASILSRLLTGDSLALSAPTSFGKSFIIDSYVKIKSPNNVLIIVPTLALADETRRRLQRKFGREYNVITSTEPDQLGERNIFVFPQERAISYADSIPELDLLVVDEFYKASIKHDFDRSATLIRAILTFSARAKQRYFLAPNVSSLAENPFTIGMDFMALDYNTVVLDQIDLYKQVGNDPVAKSNALLGVLDKHSGKSLVYAGTYSGIKEVAAIVLEGLNPGEGHLLTDAREWIESSYGPNWILPHLMARGIGIHNGQIHRSLSQLQIRLFEERFGIHILISTSSIIEGVNTSAENVILWKNKNGKSKLTDFEYRNIMGRSGRMFRHFVGRIFVLEEPPEIKESQLSLELPESLLVFQDVQDNVGELTRDQRASISRFDEYMRSIYGGELPDFSALHLQTSDSEVIKKIAGELRYRSNEWTRLGYLNSERVDDWDSSLYKVLALAGGAWDAPYKKFVAFVKIASKNWICSIPDLLNELQDFDIDIDLFFKLERNLTFKLATLLGDINTLGKTIPGERRYDISAFVFKASNAFLPPLVFQLEEYGLPRMLSRKLHDIGFMDFEDQEMSLPRAINLFRERASELRSLEYKGAKRFERYIIDYFLEGLG
ncbi:DEAD/DEAH box helicase [Luteibacter sp. CQ10]|uniref:DEAD/DEAH box helicase n=1 Tax=Luteibacter sp. CQ10 TaxID=2805821 RepID=UPI0034A27CED